MGAMIVGLGLAAWGAGCGGRSVLFVDRIEEGRAVLVNEAGGVEHADAADLPPSAGEGDVLVDWKPDPAEAEARRRDIAARRARLLHDDGADLLLEDDGR